MSKEEKSISIIDFLGKKTDWKKWSEIFFHVESGGAIKISW